MQRALGFAPQGTLEEGLRELVEWGRRQAAEDRVDAAAKELEAYGLAQG
ncbi:MAG: hypothetical protein HYS71_06155 [Candidatus Omnitrophica bacterium]|nr:hypothetical protein [Candidatus Omnitrophota bacterium]